MYRNIIGSIWLENCKSSVIHLGIVFSIKYSLCMRELHEKDLVYLSIRTVSNTVVSKLKFLNKLYI